MTARASKRGFFRAELQQSLYGLLLDVEGHDVLVEVYTVEYEINRLIHRSVDEKAFKSWQAVMWSSAGGASRRTSRKSEAEDRL